jgi:hypothetical protein
MNIRRTISAGLISVFVALATAALAGDKPLDGKSFAGTITKKGKESGDPDVLIFKDGKFTSTACEKYGFGPTSYTTQNEAKKTLFEADVTSTGGAKAHWSGTVEGDVVHAVMTWSKGSESTTYVFKSGVRGT